MSANGATSRILVIEDNPIARKMVRLALTGAGYSVVEAPDGRTALEEMQRDAPDLVLQDLVLPDIEGFELLGRLREASREHPVPIIGLSGLVSKLEEARTLSAGFDDFLVKPVEPSRLVEVVESYLPRLPPPRSGSGRSVLVVDDNAVQLKLARLQLAQLGFGVTTASDGSEALEKARRSPPDAILSDVLMPTMDGFGLCWAVRSDPRLARIPVVLISSNYVEDQDVALARRVGASAFVLRTPSYDKAAEALLESLQTGQPPPAAGADEEVVAEYTHRILRQLDRQIAMNASLLQTSALTGTALAVLSGTSRALAERHDLEATLGETLYQCLDTAGLSMAAIYVLEPDGGLILQAQAGLPERARQESEGFFGHPELLRAALTRGTAIALPSSDAPEEAVRELLARAGTQSALIVPFPSRGGQLGALFLSRSGDLGGEGWLPLAQALAAQFGQAIALAQTFRRVVAAEERYRGLFEGAVMGVYQSTPEGRILMANPALARMLGYESPENLIAGVADLGREVYLDPDHSARLVRLLEQKGVVEGFETRFRRRDGRVIWVRQSVRAVQDESGRVGHYEGMLLDVTRQKRAELRLATQFAVTRVLANARTLAAAMPEVLGVLGQTAGLDFADLWRLGADGLLECEATWRSSAVDSSAFESATRSSRLAPGEGLPGRVWQAGAPIWVEHLDRDPSSPRAAAASESGIRAGLGSPIRAADRLLGVVGLYSHEDVDSDTELLEMLDALGRQIGDFVERKRAEEALKVSEARYRSLALATSQMVWTTDPAGHVVEDQPSWRAYTGMSFEQCGGWGWSTALHPEDREALLEGWRHSLATGEVYESECRLRRADGQYRLFAVRGVPVRDEAGNLTEWVGTCTDVSERRRLQTQLHQAQKMEAVGQLAGGVAHDFNNLLGVITGYSELLAKGFEPGHTAHRRVEQIRKAALRAAGLTRQLLAFSRRQVLQPKIVDLGAIVAELEKMLRRLIGEDVEIVTVFGPKLGQVLADPGQIEQVIVNLAVNARDAMPSGGKLIIETANVDLDDAYARTHEGVRPGPYVLLSVSDTGHGMDAETLSHVFEPFFTTKEEGKGTGLGLSTVYGIVTQSGGSINVYSEPGHGTTFKIYLPRTDLARPPSEVEPPSPVPSGTETVLLVEDAEGLRLMMREILEAGGYTVIEAAGPEHALAAVERHKGAIDIMVSDVVMPRMSGRELAEKLNASRPRMKVLYVSGYPDQVISHHGVLEPGTHLLEKPFTTEALLRRIRSVLDGA